MGEASGPLLLSIVLPVYNGEKYLPESLGSVARAVGALPEADRARVEVVFCDNHSTDRTADLAMQYAPSCEYRVIRPPAFLENRTKNWHHALSAARAPWMMMLHADDQFSPKGMPALLRACRRALDGPAVLILGRHQAFAEDGSVTGLRPAWPLPSLVRGRDLRRLLSYHCALPPFTVMRRAAYGRVGGLDDRYELLQDWDLWIRLLALGDLDYLPVEVGRWRLHGFSDKYATLMAREMVAFSGAVTTLIPDLPERRLPWLRRVHLAKARMILPAHIPAERVEEGQGPGTSLPGLEEAKATMADAYRRVRRALLRTFLAGSISAPGRRGAAAH